ncbi:MAG: molecular chaperone DnaK [SAR202 cluster bacterium]|nr:molecular chaperone DnaK [SAR202 cluster bacterium]
MAKAVGIDLGTTNSVVAVVEGGQPVVLENAEGSRITPSVVGVNAKTGERYVGLAAKRQAVVNPEQTVFSIKRLMGRKFEDSNVKLDVSRLPYSIDRASNGDAHVTMGEQLYSPPEVSAMVLQKLKLDAEAKLGDKVTEAVITVPAYFNDAQRQATKDAGRIAGLDVLRIINEPTAASLAYGLDKKTDATIAVFDLGGGTFDITILRLGEGVFEVLSTSGDTHLGGDDFDQVIMDWLVEEFRQETGVDLNQDRMALQRLREAAEKAKVELSSVTQTEINLPFISADHTGPKHLVRTLPRAKLEQLASELLVRIENPCLQALKDAEVTNAKVDEVILVGGMTRMPAVYEKVRGLFEKEPNKSVNPDEAVAAGAALQAAVLKGDVRDILLLDVTPLTVGLETLGGVTTALINRNTTIPSSKSQVFTTAEDNQGSVEIHVLQGERPMATANKSIGRFILDGILPAPRGVPKIEVTFDIDANGILSVQAKDEATGREQKIVIEASSGLSPDEIDRLIKDAEDHADEDRRQREQVDLDNTVDQMIYGAEKTLTDNSENIPEEVKSDVQSKIDDLRKAKESQDSVRIQSSIEQLTASLQQIGAQAYGGADPSSETSEGGIDASDLESTEDNPGESVEGEFREVDPDGDGKQE